MSDRQDILEAELIEHDQLSNRSVLRLRFHLALFAEISLTILSVDMLFYFMDLAFVKFNDSITMLNS